MGKRKSSISFWALKRPFHFETKAALKDVIVVLKRLEDEVGFVNVFHNDIAIAPLGTGYTFGYRVRRKRHHWDVIPVGEGRVWQKENEHVIVEGTAQVSADIFYLYVGFCLVWLIITGVAELSTWILAVPCLILFGLWMIGQGYWHRNHVINRIQEAIMLAEKTPFYEKEKRPDAENVKTVFLTADASTFPGGVWNDAISEYDSIKKE